MNSKEKNTLPEEFFSEILRQSRDGIIVTDLNGIIYFFNDAASEIFGYSMAEVVGKPIGVLCFTEDQKVVCDNLLKNLDTREILKAEFFVVSKSGEPAWIEVERSLVHDEETGLDRIVIHAHIVDKPKTKIQEQEKADSVLRYAFESSPRGSVLLDENGVVLDYNTKGRVFCNILFDTDLTKGVEFAEMVSGEKAELVIELLNRTYQGTQHSLEFKMLNKDGKPQWIEMYFNPALTGQARFIVNLNFTDISHIKVSEERFRKQNEELQKSNDELDRFVYSTSHDLRAPLNSLQGLIELFYLEDPNEAEQEYLDLMLKSIMRMDGFIKEIMHFSRNSRLDMKAVLINFTDLFQEVFENLKYIDGANSIEIIIKTDEDAPFYCDKTRLGIILSNIITNGIRYHDPSKPYQFLSLSVKTTQEYADITVDDNGSGINEEQLPKIFDMFYRASTDSTGSGLGLYIVNEIITKLNGNISVSSLKGEGTTFRLRIPNTPQV